MVEERRFKFFVVFAYYSVRIVTDARAIIFLVFIVFDSCLISTGLEYSIHY